MGPWRRVTVVALAIPALVALVLAVSACGDGAGADDRPSIVVTTPALGALVREVVGDAANVSVVMPNGADPHEYRPSAKDVATMNNADLVVENGLELEEGLHDVLERLHDDGRPVFTAADHVPLRAIDDEEHAEGDHHAGDDHDHGEHDPHIWLDPIAMREMTRALVPAVQRHTGLDVSSGGSDVERRLGVLDADIRQHMQGIPADGRRIVTGHESMGYFADRYDLEVVGVLLPSRSSQASASAANLAALADVVQREGIGVIYAEVGTPEGVADSVANQTGARVVELGTHTLPDDGSYFTLMTDIAQTIHDAQAG